MKPLFDIVWNACGFPESGNFDADGKTGDRLAEAE
jgi:hypothetical protein